MSDAPIPAGKFVFLPTRTGFIDATAFPPAGIALRGTGEVLIMGGGEAFAARLTPDDMALLGAVLLQLAEHATTTAAEAAQAALDRVVVAAGENRA